MASELLNGAGTIANVAGAGPDWSSPSNAGASDNVYAQCTINANASDKLRFTNFDLSGLPDGAVIDGLEISIEANRQSVSGTLNFDSAQIVIGGAAAGDENTEASALTSGDATYTRGGSTDLWGLGAIHRDALDSGFGFQIGFTGDGVMTARVDYATMTIHYHAPGAMAGGSMKTSTRITTGV